MLCCFVRTRKGGINYDRYDGVIFTDCALYRAAGRYRVSDNGRAKGRSEAERHADKASGVPGSSGSYAPGIYSGNGLV